ncbi:glucanase [Serratia phage vB_SmaM-Kashira]|nr:glucanase [Serratia phage vB_SmaM-Kashira]
MKGAIVLKSSTLSIKETASKLDWKFSEGCEYLNFFNGPTGNLSRNLIIGKDDVDVIGTPVANGHSVTFNHQQNFLQTKIKHTDRMTILAVGKAPDPAEESFMVSNYGGIIPGTTSTTTGQSLMFRAGTNCYHILTTRNKSTGATGLVQTAATQTLGKPQCLVARFGGVNSLNGTNLFNMTNGTNNANGINPDVVEMVLGADLRIGSGYSLAAGKPAEIYAIAIWSRVLGTAEIQAVYADIKSRMGEDGVPI